MNNSLYREILPAREKINFSELTENDFEQGIPHILPEMKINFAGDVLSANRSAKKLLQQFGVESGWQLQLFFSTEHPEILQRGCCADFEISTKYFVYSFSAVAFDEADYVGLHCYRATRNETINTPQELFH
jgi:hypothetical protein